MEFEVNLIKSLSEYGFMWVFSIFMLFIMNKAVQRYLEITEKGIEKIVEKIDLMSKSLEQNLVFKIEQIEKEQRDIKISLEKTALCLSKISELFYKYERTPITK